MELIDIVLKLTGYIRPVGDSRIDEQRLVNLKEFCKLFDKMHEQLHDIVHDFRHDQQNSVQLARKEAIAALTEVSIESI